MSMLKLKISGQVPLGGKRPGEIFMLEMDDEGLPTDQYWRRRLNEEDKYHVGALSIMHDAPKPIAAQGEPTLAPQPAPSIPTPAPASTSAQAPIPTAPKKASAVKKSTKGDLN